ncbi:survival protein sure-like phosphatase/nucleotidase [Biscogniauxia mediterranea]|nr:survival protein sure-like phosphatase/nucleotidase [Biscogniauxia mediterranea]
MHILVTNDDGPPSPTSSPYVHSLVRELQKAGHTVSVCLPHTQRSWIGKAHMIGQTVKPLYYRPSATFDPSPSAAHKAQGTTYTRPTQRRRRNGGDAVGNGAGRKEAANGDEAEEEEEEEEWILVDGTPASCAQIGLHHFFQDKGPVDLVVSGPNYGRNTTAVFALSSGTLGGALEAAVCRKKSVALSYAFFTRNHDPSIIGAASRHSVRVIERLYAQWPSDNSVDLYSVNVPLVEGVETRKTLYTAMLQNYWGNAEDGGACFEEVEGSVGDEDEEEERIREDEEATATPAGEGDLSNGTAKAAADKKKREKDNAYLRHRHFKWAPRFADVYKSVEDAAPGNDGWAVKEGFTSVTPMKANFWHSAIHLHGEELILDVTTNHPTLTMALRPKNHFYALIAYDDTYVQPLILAALQKLFTPESYTLLTPPPSNPKSTPTKESRESNDDDEGVISLPALLPANHPDASVLQITPYEAIDWEYVAKHPRSCLVNSYMLRKALIRKHYLASTVEHWVAKRPQSALSGHVKRAEAFEVDYAEFLDDALIEAFDLRASLERNAQIRESGEGKEEVEWWILKPSMSDRGQGIRLFSTMEELQGIFDGWEGSDDEDEEEEEEGEDDKVKEKQKEEEEKGRDYITASHLRHFVAQPYIHPPLLLPAAGNRKFHIRTYVACVGGLDVYVYRPMLALFAAKPYVAPGSAAAAPLDLDLEAHLTNTCLQRSVAEGTVRRFWDLDMPFPAPTSASSPEGKEKGKGEGEKNDMKEHIFAQVRAATGELFEAAARGAPMHFRPLPNAFEAFGLDFLVDARGTAWLLEVNAFPDFRQTGDDPELRALVAGFWEEALRVAVGGFFGGVGEEERGVVDGDREGEGEGDKERLVRVRRVDLGMGMRMNGNGEVNRGEVGGR